MAYYPMLTDADGVRKVKGYWTNNPPRLDDAPHPGPQVGWYTRPDGGGVVRVNGQSGQEWVRRFLAGKTDGLTAGMAKRYPDVVEIARKLAEKYPNG